MSANTLDLVSLHRNYARRPIPTARRLSNYLDIATATKFECIQASGRAVLFYSLLNLARGALCILVFAMLACVVSHGNMSLLHHFEYLLSYFYFILHVIVARSFVVII
jgi:hypothetical protein